MDKEAQVTIGGVELTFAQSMALRVAVGSMLLDLNDKKYRRDLGDVAEFYQARLGEIEKLMLASIRQK